MKLFKKRSPFEIVLGIGLIFLTPSLNAQNAGSLQGYITGESGPIDGAIVILELDPGDGVVQHTIDTGPFGFVNISDIVPGTYRLTVQHPAFVGHEETLTIGEGDTLRRTFTLARAFSEAFFDIQIQVADVMTGLPLGEVPVDVQVFASEASVNPESSRSVSTDEEGHAVVRGMRNGFYRFLVNAGSARPKWRPYVTPNRRFLDQTHAARILLEPFDQVVQFKVVGFDPLTGPNGTADRPLEGFFVTLTGVDPSDLDEVVMATRTGVSDSEGIVLFSGLPAIPYRVTTRKLGYQLFEEVIHPDPASGDLPGSDAEEPHPLSPAFNPNKIFLTLTHPYTDDPDLGDDLSTRDDDERNLFVVSLPVRIQGLAGTAAEGIDRMNTLYWSFNNTNYYQWRTLFNLLPGRYRLSVDGQQGSRYFPFEPHFRGEIYVDVPDVAAPGDFSGGWTEARMDLEALPSVIRGLVHLADASGLSRPNDLFNSEPIDAVRQPLDPEGNPAVIEFVEYAGSSYLRTDLKTVTVVPDANGRFTVRLLPGEYGIRIPAMTDYIGHRIRVRDRSLDAARQEEDILQGWPYADLWPEAFGLPPANGTPNFGYPVTFRSNHDYQLDLFLRKQVVSVAGRVTREGGNVIESPENGGTVTLRLGQASFEAPIQAVAGSGPHYRVADVPPGTYVMETTHPYYDTAYPQGAMVQIPTRPPPGVLPTEDPRDMLGFPFSTVSMPITMTYLPPSTTITVQGRRWRSGGYQDPTTWFSGNLTVRPKGRNIYIGSIPRGAFDFWIRLQIVNQFNGRVQGEISNEGEQKTITVFFGGGPDDSPDSEVRVDPPPPLPVDWTLRSVNGSDASILVPGTQATLVRFEDTDELRFERTLTGGIHTESGWLGTLTPIEVSNPFWVVENVGPARMTDRTTGALETVIKMQRGVSFQGSVSLAGSGESIAHAPIEIRSRYGNILRETETGADGTFVVAQRLAGSEPIFVEAAIPGFIPWRKRFSSNDAVPVPDDPQNSIIQVDIEVNRIPPPVFGTPTFDRFGRFLPGVKAAGNQAVWGFAQALEALVMTWTLPIQPSTFSYTIPAFDRSDGSGGGTETHEATDDVTFVALMDTRYYGLPGVRADPAATPPVEAVMRVPGNPYSDKSMPIVLPPPSQDPRLRRELLTDVIGGMIPNVAFQLDTEFETGEGSDAVTASEQLPLWRLPPGKFNPFFAVLTRYGAVEFVNFEYPDPLQQLEGVRLPRWLAFAADLLGTVAGFQQITGAQMDEKQVKQLTPEGRLTALPEFTAKIQNKNGFIDYEYDIKLLWNEGMKTPRTGLLSLAPNNLGLEFTGQGSFGLKGTEGKLFLGVGASVMATNDLTRMLPAKLTNLFRATGRMTVEASTTASKVYSPIAQPYEFELVNTVGGGVVAKLLGNARPITSKLPYIGPVMATLDRSKALVVEGTAVMGVGLVSSNIWRTPFPPSRETESGVIGLDRVYQRHFLGGTQVENSFDLCVLFGLGVRVEIAQGRAGAEGRVNLEGERCRAGFPSMSFTPNSLGDWPPITRVVGQATLTLEAFVDLWVARSEYRWRWPFAEIDIQLGTKPSFQLIPMEFSRSTFTPDSAFPVVFQGESGNLVDDLYPVAPISTASRSGEAFTFTDIDPATGRMILKMSLRDGAEDFGAPVQVADAAGILNTSIAQLPDDRWLLVWTELSTDALGNPFPSSRIVYSLGSVDGSTWSTPETVIALDDVATELNLVSSESMTGLVFLHTPDGPLATRYSLQAMAWDGAEWGSPVMITADAEITGFDVAAPAATAGDQQSRSGSTISVLIAYADADGRLHAVGWNGEKLLDPTDIAESGSGQSLALVSASNGESLLAWESGDEIAIASLDAAGEWTSRTLALGRLFPSEIRMASFDGGDEGGLAHALVWISATDAKLIQYVYLDAAFNLLSEPELLAFESRGRFSDLHVYPRAAGEAVVVARWDDDTVQVREFTLRPGSTEVESRFLGIQRLENGTVQMQFLGDPRLIHRIQHSIDLENWRDLRTLFPTEGMSVIVDPNAPDTSEQFYRAVSP